MRMLLLTLALACSDDTTPDTSPVDPDPDPVTTSALPSGDTAVDDGWVPQFFNVSAVFAADPITGTLASYTDVNGTFLPYMAIHYFEENAVGAAECVVLFIVDDPSTVPLLAWTFEDATDKITETTMFHTGWMVPDDARVETLDCDEVSPSFDPVGALVDGEWGVGVGTLRSDVEARFADDETLDPFWGDAVANQELLGGSWTANVWEPSTWASHAVLGNAVQQDGTVAYTKEGWPANPIEEGTVIGGTLPAARLPALQRLRLRRQHVPRRLSTAGRSLSTVDEPRWDGCLGWQTTEVELVHDAHVPLLGWAMGPEPPPAPRSLRDRPRLDGVSSRRVSLRRLHAGGGEQVDAWVHRRTERPVHARSLFLDESRVRLPRDMVVQSGSPGGVRWRFSATRS